MSIGIEYISIGFTRKILIIVVIPIESKRSVVGRLVLVVDLELVRETYPRDTHEGVVISEFSGGESDGVSCSIYYTFYNSRIGILFYTSFIREYNMIVFS